VSDVLWVSDDLWHFPLLSHNINVLLNLPVEDNNTIDYSTDADAIGVLSKKPSNN